MKKKNEQTFDKKIKKETDQAEKDLKKLKGGKFVCVPDAENEATIWAPAHTHHRLVNLQILPLAEKVEKRRGRPKKNELINVSFQIEAEIELNEDALAEERKMFGRFVLASNKTDLDPEVMLNYYKGQQTVERKFRFLKNKSFHVSEVYLKNEESKPTQRPTMRWVFEIFMIAVNINGPQANILTEHPGISGA